MHQHLLDAIGNTPLARVPFNTPATVYAKLEYLNPGGSIKDRTALYMIEYAEKTGQLQPGGTIIDASSGNYGITVAMIGAAKGYKVIITTTPKISQEKLQTMQAYGAHVIVCPSAPSITDPSSHHSTACNLHKKTPNSFMPNQYFNPINAQAHYTSTGPEIWQQTNGTITHFFAATGSGGTVAGIGKYLKEQNPAVKIIALDSNNSFHSTKGHPKPYKVEGMGIDFYSDVIDYHNNNVIDEIIPVSDEDAFAMLKNLARNYGFLVGLTSGAVAWGTQHYFSRLKKDDVVVMIFGDSGRAYLTKNVY
ncbi:MAG TPA: cysteine synthase family protein [Candidatus Babeliales bacterium]|jgi:cystathionine beta-synthase|nr:cysteine synthase family protein [Candidatus Babeliales bacterium]